MTLCPYCDAELDLIPSILEVEIDKDFKDGMIRAQESALDMHTDAMPFGGKIAKKLAKAGQNSMKKYYEKIDALPIVILSCKKCNKTINAQLFLIGGSGGDAGGGASGMPPGGMHAGGFPF